MILQQSNSEVLEELTGILSDFDYTQVVLTESQTSMIQSIFTDKFSKLLPTMMNNFEQIPELLLGKGSDVYNYLMDSTEKLKKRLAPKVASDRARLIQASKTKGVINEDTEQANKLLSHNISNYFKEAISEMNIAIKDVKSKKNTNFTDAIVSFLLVFIANTFAAAVITSILFGLLGMPILTASGVGMLLVAFMVAPLTEEYAKKNAIENDYASEYILTFNVGEYLLYVSQFKFKIGIILLRMLPFLMHFTTMSILKGNFNKSSKYSVGTNRKVDDEDFSNAIKVHAGYNIAGVALELGIRALSTAAAKA